MNKSVALYQIYYNQQTKSELDTGFLPLDNMANERPDWYELWPILNFLKNNRLDDDCWYGFFSPKFPQKTGMNAHFLHQIIESVDQSSDVVLLSYAWDQLSYFKNPFEQGDIWHPGISDATQSFLDLIGFKLNIVDFVTCTANSVFCNYLIAKPTYWKKWLKLAELFFQVVESGLIPDLKRTTSYVSTVNQTPIKTFIQERLSSLILSDGSLNITKYDQSISGALFGYLFDDSVETRRSLIACDVAKELYLKTKDPLFLKSYIKIRESIKLKI